MDIASGLITHAEDADDHNFQANLVRHRAARPETARAMELRSATANFRWLLNTLHAEQQMHASWRRSLVQWVKLI